MINDFKASDKIGDIVTTFPGASNLFLEYRIDFCCGGNRPLSEAIREQKLDENKVVTLLNEKYKEFRENNIKFTDWAKEEPSSLIDYVINNHHAFLNRELPAISELSLKILTVHGKKHPELFKVHKLFNTLRIELEEHLLKEEQLVFPMIKEYEASKTASGRQNIIDLINELENEHEGAGDIIKELRKVTNHYVVPKDGCKTFELTYKKLMELEKDTFEHIHLENNILFKNI